mmetsp:Transcript_26132/g.38293  ORF Transcript_26132/g.38293 Transcript_26132/m.38293 type:complete len:90 (+) Transcript_26132:168-437(+)
MHAIMGGTALPAAPQPGTPAPPPAVPEGFIVPPQGYPVTVHAVPAAPHPPQPQTIQVHAIPAAQPAPTTVQAVAPVPAPVVKAEAAPAT